MSDTFTPNLNLDKPVISAFDIWGAKFNLNMDLIDAASITLRGIPVSSSAPLTGQVLTFNGTQWVAAPVPAALHASNTVEGITFLSIAPVVLANPIAVGDNDPRMINARAPIGAAGGDLAGSAYPNPIIAKIQGVTISGTPSIGKAITATSSTAATWSNPVSSSFVFQQITPLATWTVIHNLGKYPSVSIVDSGGSIVFGEVNYTSLNQIVVSFSAAFSGQAFLN